MGSLLVVHGTGVRGVAFEDTVRVVKAKLDLARPHIDTVKCAWGDTCGAKLSNPPKCIPVDSSRGDGQTADDLEIEEWAMLYEDPLAELRDLASRLGGGDWDAAELLTTFRAAEPNARLTEALAQLQMVEQWRDARGRMTHDPVLTQAAARAPGSTLELRGALARAIVAQLTAEAIDKCTPVPDDELRRLLVREMVSIFRPDGEIDSAADSDARGVGDFTRRIKNSLTYGAQWLTAGAIERKRLAEAAQIAPVAGDVILYQSPQGNAIRDFVAAAIGNLPKPRYVLAHSLGSVAAVDVLIQNPGLDVAHLITIGSPAALFFEMNALVACPADRPLPGHFPKWLNIYDPRDMLSYLARPAFHDDERILDRSHESGQPLLAAHSAYWASDRAWKYVWEVIPAL